MHTSSETKSDHVIEVNDLAKNIAFTTSRKAFGRACGVSFAGKIE
jgi:hypothetical protein